MLSGEFGGIRIHSAKFGKIRMLSSEFGSIRVNSEITRESLENSNITYYGNYMKFNWNFIFFSSSFWCDSVFILCSITYLFLEISRKNRKFEQLEENHFSVLSMREGGSEATVYKNSYFKNTMLIFFTPSFLLIISIPY